MSNLPELMMNSSLPHPMSVSGSSSIPQKLVVYICITIFFLRSHVEAWSQTKLEKKRKLHKFILLHDLRNCVQLGGLDITKEEGAKLNNKNCQKYDT